MTLHFSAKQNFEDGTVRLNWCKMSFKPDFIEILKEYGTIPKQKIESVLKLMVMQKDGMKAIEERDEAIEKSQEIIKHQHEQIVNLTAQLNDGGEAKPRSDSTTSKPRSSGIFSQDMRTDTHTFAARTQIRDAENNRIKA